MWGVMSLLDKVEKGGQSFYFCAMGLAPSFWLKDNFKPEVAKEADASPAVKHHMALIGCLIGCITGMSGLVRASPACTPILKEFDIVTGTAWLGCLGITVYFKDLYKDLNLKINLGIQTFFAAGFFYQALTR